MADEPDYVLDLSGADEPDAASDNAASGNAGRKSQSRRWIGIHFECCGVYSRIYRNANGTQYVGYCPRCQKKVQVKVGQGGISARFFKAK